MYVAASPQLNNVLKVDQDKNMAGKRVYQVWKGSNRFFFNGRLIFGPDVRSLLATIVLIVAPIVVFCVFVARHLMNEFPHHGGIAILVVAVVHTSGVLVLLLLTSGRDPGIIPRNLHPPEAEEEVISPSDWSGGQTPRSRLPRTKDIIVNGVAVKIKYCDTCMLYRPPRCSHCSICNNCVERFDHHCPWVGQCIGRRNYPYFFMFVFSTTILCFYIFAMCALRIKMLIEVDPPHTVQKALQRSPASAVLMAYTFLATWFVGGLTVFHIYLTSTNQTTYENFRYRYDNKANPYNQGIVHNIKQILCSTIPPSKNNFRAKAQQDASNVGIADSQPRKRADIMVSNDTKACSDVELGGKARWTSVVSGEVAQEVHGQTRNNGCVSKEMKQGYEDAFAESLNMSIPNEGREIWSGVNPRHSSWGHRSENWEISSEIRALSSGVGEDGSRRNGQNTPVSNR